MALDYYKIIDAYDYLQKIYNDITDTNIEQYSNQLYRIENNLKIIKRFISSSLDFMFKDDAVKLYNNYLELLKKLYYYIQHKEDAVLRNVVDSCDVVVFK